MKTGTALLGGLAGATAVTLMHEGVRRVVPEAPRMDLLGMQAISKSMKNMGCRPPAGNKLFVAAMVGDVVSNAIYYSAAGIGTEKNIWLRGASLGLAAGLGAVLLPKPMGLNERRSNKTVATQLMTVGLYVTGALVATAVIKLLNKKKAVKNQEWERRLVTSAMG